MTKRRLSSVLLLFVTLATLALPTVQAQSSDAEAERAATEAQLEAIQQELEKRQADMGERERRLSRTERQLQQMEAQISAVATELNDTENALRDIQLRLDELATQLQQLQAQEKRQLELLEKQVDTAYRGGQHDFLKMVLNQNDPARVERMLTYYQYLNEARIEEIEAVLATRVEIEQVREQVAAQEQQLAQRRQQQQRQQTVLREQQSEQQQLVAKLQRELVSDTQRIEQLRQDQAELENVLDAIIAALRDDVQLNGLSKQKGSLRWPTEGRVQRLFATSRSGSVDWKGVLIDGDSGQAVVSIADGRVLYANWMRGFGLLLIIDHGDGYMSLYGHNQTILPQVGSKVRTGETVALMGQSGGRSEPALYFEIRVRGNAVNPTQWCR